MLSFQEIGPVVCDNFAPADASKTVQTWLPAAELFKVC